jgi:hypothetical protein
MPSNHPALCECMCVLLFESTIHRAYLGNVQSSRAHFLFLSLSEYLFICICGTYSLSLFRIEIGNVRESGNSCGSREVFEILDVKSLLSKLGTSLLFSVVTHVHIIGITILFLLLLQLLFSYVCIHPPPINHIYTLFPNN